MTIVKSTYNFVPAPKEDEVFYPDWADQVNQDIPFSDGESGEIEFTITAETPIFIRNGHSEADQKIFEKYKNRDLSQASQEEKEAYERYISFSNLNGKYFIPATSLKGMFRSILEVMSFSRLKAENDIFPFRNLKDDKYGKAVMKNRQIKTGWLQKESDGSWIIWECEHKRVAIKDIESKFKIVLKEKSSVEKYREYDNKGTRTVYYVKNVGFRGQDELFQLQDNGGKTFRGELVFYGNMGNKKYEYIFGDEKKRFSVSNDLMQRFIELEEKKHNDKKQEDSLFCYLRKRTDKIPVVFYAEGNQVKHFGFSRLYKMSNVNRVNELSPINSYPKEHAIEDADLAETIFGSTGFKSDNGNESLKGRVYFGNAKCSKGKESKKNIPVVLGSPKASYYPFYLKGKKTYLLSENDAELSGFKKYPVHLNTKKSKLNEENTDIQTKLKPLNEGSKFQGRVRLHNLKKEEIGALLSAITFHGNTKNFSHNIGMAKPLGYGKIKVVVEKLNGLENSQSEYLSYFEKIMDEHTREKLNKGWLKTEQVLQLLAMSQRSISKAQNNLLVYPKIENEQRGGKSDFELYDHLPKFKGNIIPNSIVLKAKEEREQKEKLEREKIRKEREQKEKKLVEKLLKSGTIEEKKEILEKEDLSISNKNKISRSIDKDIIAQKEQKAQKRQDADLKFASSKFKDIREECEKYTQNKHFEFSEKQKQQIEDQIRLCWKEHPEDFHKKNGKRKKFKRSPFGQTGAWIGRDRALKLYQELINT